ncbi:thiamine diphosphate-binding protein [Talaromyces proteolyticus]|uniref:Pyruvate decarboxylase n=1 Tax=Talaromyces proteolyticus TaxID=1131652 RepID=A0AAD4KDH5_9EURO|nr:thiamine diphosphate-binding protein [Talaromyces proteolyticus]KAH8689125.1 thiamine diphosphate-binding protein [Talaromyces proteolyticus]
MSEILIGEFLLKRIRELGIETIFGVPGDYELAFLDLVEPAGLKWVGTPNELVGAYAADGYARQKGAGALVTTFGPGELSALCGIGGANCESVPIVHIVGYPTEAAQKSGNILHHTLGDLNYNHYVKISDELSCATTILHDAATAVAEIDRVLNAMIYHSKPVYIGISEDVAYSKVPISVLDSKLIRGLPSSDPTIEIGVIADIINKLESASSPAILVDGGASRSSWAAFVDPLIAVLKVPAFVTCLGKGAVDESSPYFAGAYAGLGSWPNVIKMVEASDCILWLGRLPSDFNTGAFTEHVDLSAVIDLQRFSVEIGGTKFDAKINHVLPKLIDTIKQNSILASRPSRPLIPRPPLPQSAESDFITQDWVWERLSSFLKPGDLLVSETGTAQVGVLSTKLPSGASHWTQAVWGSIGYATGAAVGASIGAKETGKFKRLVLLTGEGSLQMTIQAFSILNRHGIVPVVFILNNSGYTVERYFCGWEAIYNDVPAWDYGKIFSGLAPNSGARGYKVTSRKEFDALLNDPDVQNATYPQAIDFVMTKADAPTPLKWIFNGKKG